MLIPSALLALSAAAAAWWVARALASDDLVQGDEWRYDVTRINQLRKVDSTYRLFHPLVRFLAKMNRGAFRESLPEIQRQILASGQPRFWLPEEYLARMQVHAILLAPFYFFVCIRLFDLPGAVMALLLTALTLLFFRVRLAARARRRLVLIKRRMPYLLDMLTLLMEAGSTFIQSLRQSVRELEGHPVATEFNRVLLDMNLGKTRRQSLEAMRDRLGDEEVAAIIGAILQGEELGTPLASVFRTQSDVLRMKRSQRAESMAGEAGVNMLLPAVLVMASTVLIIFGPFILNYLYSGFGV